MNRTLTLLSACLLAVPSAAQQPAPCSYCSPCRCAAGKCPACPVMGVPDPMPVGTPPGPGFAWRHLPHCGWGWVHESVNANPRASLSTYPGVAYPSPFDRTSWGGPAALATPPVYHTFAPRAYSYPAPVYPPAAGGCPNGTCPLRR